MHEITLLSAERMRLPDGREFRSTGDAARALIADGVDPAEPMTTRWADGRASMAGTVGCFARWRIVDGDRGIGRAKWAPHPQAVLAPALAAWAEKLAAEPARRAR